MDAHTAALKLYLSQRGFHFSEVQLGEPFAGYKDFDACVAANRDKGDAHAYCGYIKSKTEPPEKQTEIPGTSSYAGAEPNKNQASRDGMPGPGTQSTAMMSETRKQKRKISEIQGTIRSFNSVQQLQEALQSQSFSWYPNLEKLKELGKNQKGKFLLIEGLHPMITDPFNVGHGSREWTKDELMKSAYTAIGKGFNINHEIPLNAKYKHVVVDGEFNTETNTAEYIAYEEDPEILDLIREGYITHVSMQGYPRNEETKCDTCGSTGCNCRSVPRGVIFGEGDNVAIAYVVTRDGAKYMGKPVPAERPGDWNSSVQIAETNQSRRNSSLLLLQSHITQMGITRQDLFSALPAGQLKESVSRVLFSDKALYRVLGEDLQSFNDALASGDALRALSVLANDLYQSLNNQKQSFPDPAPHNTASTSNPQGNGSIPKQQPQAQTGPFSNTEAGSGSLKNYDAEDSSFASSTGSNAVGTMPQNKPPPPSDVPRGQPEVPDGVQPQSYSVPPGKSPPSNKKMTREDVDYAKDQGDPTGAPGTQKKQTIPDRGLANDSSTLNTDQKGDSGDDMDPPSPSKQGRIKGGNPSGAKSVGERDEDEDAEDEDEDEDDSCGMDGGGGMKTKSAKTAGDDGEEEQEDQEEEIHEAVKKLKKQQKQNAESMRNISQQLLDIQRTIKEISGKTTRLQETVGFNGVRPAIDTGTASKKWTRGDVEHLREIARMTLVQN